MQQIGVQDIRFAVTGSLYGRCSEQVMLCPCIRQEVSVRIPLTTMNTARIYLVRSYLEDLLCALATLTKPQLHCPGSGGSLRARLARPGWHRILISHCIG